MAQFRIKIAGRVAQVSSLFDSTRDYCLRYLTEEDPDFSVTVSREDLEFEQADLRREAEEEGLRPRTFTDPFLERTAIQRKVAEHLFDYDALLLHGSAVAVDGEGYLFTAKCGTGKSTHTRFWRQVFGSRAVMVNDDKPFLRVTEEGILLCGAPWSGKHGLDTNITVPLRGICILERGGEDRIWKIAPGEAISMLRHQSYCPLDPAKERRFHQLVDRLAAKTTLWRMECTKDPRAALVSYEAMSGKWK